MPDYAPPIDDMMFTLSEVVGTGRLPEHPALGNIDADMARSILEPAAALAAGVLAPLNKVGDRAGCTLKDGAVTTPDGFRQAYREFIAGGWNGLVFDPAHGGQGLPWLVAFAVNEMWQGANMAFGLAPLLNQGAVEAVAAHASDELKARYLEKMVSGEWTGTMNLTEPQAGSDLAAVRTVARPQDDGSYRIFGQKIFITFGEHDFTDNIIHLVLARIEAAPGEAAPEGVKGISLFVVPKFLDGGARNDLLCTGIEHKLGIHGSPTCTMQYGDVAGDRLGATGWLVGEAHQGLKYMFTMMNNARLSVGLQGVAIADAAYQHALAYAKERVQGAPVGRKGQAAVPIADHPDVRRMLLSMAAQVAAGRALAYESALQLDLARGGDAAAQARVDLMTPVVKSWCTDMAVEVASTGIQVHGGMGFVEETGAAQFYRDARILPIYEGTNGIQSADLVFRKILRDDGAALKLLLNDFLPVLATLKGTGGDDFESIAAALSRSYEDIVKASSHLGALARDNAEAAAAVSKPYLDALALAAAGLLMARGALAARTALEGGAAGADMMDRHITLARFFAEHVMPRGEGLVRTVMTGARTVTAAQL